MLCDGSKVFYKVVLNWIDSDAAPAPFALWASILYRNRCCQETFKIFLGKDFVVSTRSWGNLIQFLKPIHDTTSIFSRYTTWTRTTWYRGCCTAPTRLPKGVTRCCSALRPRTLQSQWTGPTPATPPPPCSSARETASPSGTRVEVDTPWCSQRRAS